MTFNGLFPIHINEIASTVDDQYNFLFKKDEGLLHALRRKRFKI